MRGLDFAPPRCVEQALEAAVCEAEEKARLAEDEVKAAVIAARAEGARMLKVRPGGCHECVDYTRLQIAAGLTQRLCRIRHRWHQTKSG